MINKVSQRICYRVPVRMLQSYLARRGLNEIGSTSQTKSTVHATDIRATGTVELLLDRRNCCGGGKLVLSESANLVVYEIRDQVVYMYCTLQHAISGRNSTAYAHHA